MRRLVIGLVVVVIVFAVAAWFMEGRGPQIADGSVLTLELSGKFSDTSLQPWIGRLLGRSERSLLGFLGVLTIAERDPRIETIVFKTGNIGAGWGKAEDLRSAIERASARGKHTIAYLELESLSSSLEFYVASAADEVVAAPATRSALLGLAGEYMFLGGLFEKFGIEIQYERIGRYKSAVESYAEEKMSDANREMTSAILDSIDGRFVAALAEGRGLSPAEVRSAIDQGPSTPGKLLELGLIDRVAFWDELIDGLDAPLVESDTYAKVDPSAIGFDSQATFALVNGVGAVVTGKGRFTQRGEPLFAADTVSQAIDDAVENDDVSAIVLRVDSPGGSPLASDIVWRAVQRARKAGKPVVASLSDVAASGGYYVVCGADRIVSQPGTLTGSIGVFVLRPVLGGLFDKLGLGVESMTRGARADLLLAAQPLSPGAREVLREDVRSVYALFTSRVAEGRGLEIDAVDAVGRGRVWTGEQALEIGLVDALGGIRASVDEAKELVGLERDADVLLMEFPQPKPFAEQVAEALGMAAQASVPELPLPRQAQALVSVLRDMPQSVPLLVPPVLAEIR